MPEEQLFIHHTAVIKEVLGPERRLVVWTTGCPYRCSGCIEEKLQHLEYGTPIPVSALLQMLQPYLNKLGAITFSGGEPLYQKASMAWLLKEIRKLESVDIMLYTGMPTQTFNDRYHAFHSLVDICVTEPFVQKLHGNHLWRGSSNQCILSPSGKYDVEQIQYWMNQPSAGIDLHFNETHCFTYGIPVPGSMESLHGKLQRKGIDIR